jgi:hypothetical protein
MMDRINSRIAQIYGYAVCLICVVVILISTKQVIDAAFDYSRPLDSGAAYGRFGPLTSYEAYRIGTRQSAMMMRGPDGQRVTNPDSGLSDAELRKAFASERDQQLSAVSFRAVRSLVSGIVFLVLAGTMFLLHWRWIRRTNAEAPVS